MGTSDDTTVTKPAPDGALGQQTRSPATGLPGHETFNQRDRALEGARGLKRSAALPFEPCPVKKVPKRKPGSHAGPSLRTYYSPVKNLRANLTSQEIGKARRDRGDKMARKQKLAGVALITQRE
jgi:hypothetical protein